MKGTLPVTGITYNVNEGFYGLHTDYLGRLADSIRDVLDVRGLASSFTKKAKDCGDFVERDYTIADGATVHVKIERGVNPLAASVILQGKTQRDKEALARMAKTLGIIK